MSDQQRSKPSKSSSSAQAIAVGALGLLGLWAVGCGGGSGGGSSSGQYKLSITHLKELAIGVVEYASDFDDTLPLNGKWMDGIGPYAKDDTDYHSPAVASKGYGYALNSDIAGAPLTQFPTPSTQISLFDSTDLSRNATDPTSTEPAPPRYGTRNTIAYLDGHVQDDSGTNGTPPTLYTQSMSRLKQVDLAMLIYSNDYDSATPLSNEWMDELRPYTKNNDVLFHSPAVQLIDPSQYGYALNDAVAGQLTTSFASPSTTLSFFDSTILTRNATGPTSTLPAPPRYGTNNTIAYVDGHVHP